MKKISKYIEEIIEDESLLPLKYLEGDKYMYIMEDEGDDGLNILLGYELAKIFKINHFYVDITKVKNKDYIVFEGVENYGNFYPYNSLTSNESNNLYDIWDCLDFYFENVNELMEDIIKMYIFDLLFYNSSRQQENWGILEKEKEKEKEKDTKIYMIENLCLFTQVLKPTIHCAEDNDNILDNYAEYLYEMISEITKFKNETSSEYINKCIDLVKSVDEKVLNKLINLVELKAGRTFIERPNIKKFSQIRDIILTNLQTKEEYNKKLIIYMDGKK